MTTGMLRIAGRELPGRAWSGNHNVHVADCSAAMMSSIVRLPTRQDVPCRTAATLT
jgi:hypothetical protein